MWWSTIFKWGSVIFLTIIILVFFVYILGQQMLSDKLNSKIEGESRSTSDIVLQKAALETAIAEEEPLDMGYISD